MTWPVTHTLTHSRRNGLHSQSSVIKYPPQFRCQHLSLSLSMTIHSWVFVHACVYACVCVCVFGYVALKSRNFCLFTWISIQKSLVTRSVRLCISLFVWLRWCFLSARQCSEESAVMAPGLTLSRRYEEVVRTLALLAWQARVTFPACLLMGFKSQTSVDLSTYLLITHIWACTFRRHFCLVARLFACMNGRHREVLCLRFKPTSLVDLSFI